MSTITLESSTVRTSQAGAQIRCRAGAFTGRMTRPPTRLVPVLLGFAVALATAAAPAAAQGVAPRADSASMISGTSESSMRSQIEEWMIDPRITAELGGELRFITSRIGVGDQALHFTDIGLASFTIRHAFSARAEVAAAIDLLAKQPSWLDEPALQGAHLGARFALAKHWVAWARAAGSPLLADLGFLAETSVGVETRTRIDRTVAFQAALGAAQTSLFLDGGAKPSLTELVSGGQALLRAPHGEAGMWLGVDYRIPLHHRDRGGLVLDPQTRLGFNLGCVLGWIDDWDLYVAGSVVDRGDDGAPATQLPVLDGGFDQVNLVFGAVRRWERKEIPPSALELAY